MSPVLETILPLVKNESNTHPARRAQRVKVGYVWRMIHSYLCKRQLAAAAGLYWSLVTCKTQLSTIINSISCNNVICCPKAHVSTPSRHTWVLVYMSFPSWIYDWLLLSVQRTIYLSNIQNNNKSPPKIEKIFSIYSSVSTHSPNTIRTMVSRQAFRI